MKLQLKLLTMRFLWIVLFRLVIAFGLFALNLLLLELTQ